jgi:hypothetical protein
MRYARGDYDKNTNVITKLISWHRSSSTWCETCKFCGQTYADWETAQQIVIQVRLAASHIYSRPETRRQSFASMRMFTLYRSKPKCVKGVPIRLNTIYFLNGYVKLLHVKDSVDTFQ